MSRQGGPNYERAFRVFYVLTVVTVLGMAIEMSTRPRPAPPPNNKAFGCYATNDAPAISLDAEGMTIHQPAAIHIGFHLERGKTGILLTAEAPIAANPSQGGYTYSIKPPGIGLFLDFIREVKGRTYGEFDENELREFTMLTRDNVYLRYRKASPSDCDASR